MQKSYTRRTKVAPLCALAVLIALPGCAPWGHPKNHVSNAWNAATQPWQEFGQEVANAASPDGNGVSNEARSIDKSLNMQPR